MSDARRYELKVMYGIEVTDPAALVAAAYERWCSRLTGVDEVTDWHREQWQRWVDDGTSDRKDDPAWGPDRRGVDVALHEFVGPDGSLEPNNPGATWGLNGTTCTENAFRPEGPPTSNGFGTWGPPPTDR